MNPAVSTSSLDRPVAGNWLDAPPTSVVGISPVAGGGIEPVAGGDVTLGGGAGGPGSVVPGVVLGEGVDELVATLVDVDGSLEDGVTDVVGEGWVLVGAVEELEGSVVETADVEVVLDCEVVLVEGGSEVVDVLLVDEDDEVVVLGSVVVDVVVESVVDDGGIVEVVVGTSVVVGPPVVGGTELGTVVVAGMVVLVDVVTSVVVGGVCAQTS